MPEPANIILRPIGYVRNDIATTPRPEHNWQGIVSDIVLDEALAPGLEGLARY
jgi:hypothetical protein